MKHSSIIICSLVLTAFLSVSLTDQQHTQNLRRLYSQPPAKWPKPQTDPGVQWQELKALPAPDSAYFAAQNDPLVTLGRTLFFDPRLSVSNQVSCSSCHEPELSWADGRSVSLGHDHQRGTRNTPSLLNMAYFSRFFWDGRARTLQQQAINPISTPHEMAMDLTKLIPKIRSIKGYAPLFLAAYDNEEVSMEGMLDALAAFEETITSRPGKFDDFLNGQHQSLSDEELQGLHLFRTKARCINCHHGTYFTDELFHRTGIEHFLPGADSGRFLVSRNPADLGKFRTPSLRDVMRTGPWMHNGQHDEMDSILHLYNTGMPQPNQTPIDPLIKPLGLSEKEKRALKAFLHAISHKPYKITRPALPQ
ncbi:cytochrome-c peroxidase [Flavihumibacter stibioxidans]|uniref:Cytochrome c domain-containing protein n=1 Tax=Flavihumibacter stibioxidans TaxID=1834163 RepID=A0ABR7M8L4_9BACT|nr:cytochrome c peroxidase [Flavihumibacter stibioxidans]MBC6491374.1 hypothetical protein [Flavihumibacter stibioxidans]